MRQSRRDAIRLGAASGAAILLGRDVLAASLEELQQRQLLRTIPSSGEQIPAVGLGTANTFMRAARSSREARAAIKEVVRQFTERGGAVIDTCPCYGASELVLGEFVREIGNAGDIFMATKVSGAFGRARGVEQVERSLERLAPGNVDLEQVHNLLDWRTQLDVLRELKRRNRIRYVGITTSSASAYEELAAIIRTQELDFVQFDYAIDNREAGRRLVPIAVERGIATIANLPFGRTRLFTRVGARTVPGWARAFGATTWAQFFLKWLLGDPGVTVVIPGTSDPEHLDDNMRAGLGRLPSERERRRMASLIDDLPGA